MILHYINNNLLISNRSSSGVYKDEYENLELYQEMNISGVVTEIKKTAELAVHVTHATTKI